MPKTTETEHARPPDLAFNTVSDDYLHYIKYSEGLADRTVKTYKEWLSHYRRWLEAEQIPEAFHERFNTPLLQRFRYHLSIRGLRPRTIRTIFGPLRQLGNFCVKNGVLTENPALGIKLPKKDASGRQMTSQEELKTLLGAVGRQHDKRKVALYRAMLCVLVYCGPRFQEWLDLKLSHVSLDNKTILIASGKGSKSRTLYMNDECHAAVSEYLRVRNPAARHDWLWVYDVRRRMGEAGVRQMINEVKAIAGLEGHDNIQPHSIRHAFATRLMENGGHIKSIQAALGHESLSTTYIYLHAGEEAAKPMQVYAGFERPDGQPPPQVPTAAPQRPAQREEPRSQGQTPTEPRRRQDIRNRGMRTRTAR